MNSGVYQIRNLKNGKKYIGSAVNFYKRWRVHRCHLRKGTHHNPHLQAAWDKYGEDAFVFEVLFESLKEEIIKVEQLYLDVEQPEYNICPTAGNCLGVKRSDEFKQKCRENNLGKKYSDDFKQQCRARRLGAKHTEEAKKNISLSKKNISVETRKKISEARKNMSEEIRAQIAERQKGKTYSAESKIKMSESRKAYLASKKGVESEHLHRRSLDEKN